MKRILLLCIVGALALMFQLLVNCASPLESPDRDNPNPPPPIEVHDTIFDTVFVIDTNGGEIDTVIVIDTVVEIDTIINTDTVNIGGDTIWVIDTIFDTTVEYDTIVEVDTTVAWDTVVIIDTTVMIDTTVVVDTVHVPDTIIWIDTVIGTDTVIVVDTIIGNDTVIVTDTIIQYDTTVITDTVEVPDTVVIPDTIVVPDTIFITDTVTVVDTIWVVVPDTANPPVMCARLGPAQKEIVWMFRNAEGQYRLEFTGRIEKEHPSNEVKLLIDGQEYIWDINADREFILERWLGPNAEIEIVRTKPNPFGHEIDICLTITRL